jgi:hypothetical protein
MLARAGNCTGMVYIARVGSYGLAKAKAYNWREGKLRQFYCPQKMEFAGNLQSRRIIL